MRHLGCILLCIALMAPGCRQPSDIELVADDAISNLEAFPVVLPDSNIAVSAVDSTGVLPNDQLRYAGMFVINAVTWDAGTVTKAIAYSRVFFADSSVRVLGRMVGFLGRDVGAVTLNSSLMFKIPHRIPINKLFGRDTAVVRGVEYLADLTGTYEPDRQYSWVVMSHLSPVLTVTTESPEKLTVVSPRGGATHSRTKDLPVRWTGGKGKMTIILSAYEPVQKRTLPLLELRVKTNNGKGIIPAKLLSQLPARTTFVLTFVLSNKKESQISQPVSAKILAQAASVYNSIVELR